LPPQESDIIRFGNRVCAQPLYFSPQLWQIGLSLIERQALNSLVAYLYQLFTKGGQFLKNGITQNLTK
jgi:hypothetical protein